MSAQVADVNGIRRAMILTSENWKVGGSVQSLLVHLSRYVVVVGCLCIVWGLLVIHRRKICLPVSYFRMFEDHVQIYDCLCW